MNNYKLIENNLTFILNELSAQPEVAVYFPSEMQSCEEQLGLIKELLLDAGEYGIAYELIISMIEEFPFRLSGKASVKLLEAGLIMGFKTEKPEDSKFDRR